jgi:hypothetical protein
VEVQVWLGAVAAVAAGADRLSWSYLVSRPHLDAALLEVRHERVFAISVLDDHVIAERVLRVHAPRLLVYDLVDRGYDAAGRGGEDRLSKTVVGID